MKGLKYVAVFISFVLLSIMIDMPVDFSDPGYLIMSIVFIASTIFAVTNN